MKKIFKIAAYDFRRLMLNPFTLVIMAVALVGILILGAVYKIPTTPAYVANITGQTTREVYNNFHSNNPDLDNRDALLEFLSDAQNIILAQEQSQDHVTLNEIVQQFSTISLEVKKYEYDPESSTYIANNNIDEIKQAAASLQNFVIYYENLDVFESNLFFSEKNFEELKTLSTYFTKVTSSNSSVREVLQDLSQNFSKFQTLNSIQKNVQTWQVDTERLNSLQQQYIQTAQTKLQSIENEIERLNNASTNTSDDHLEDIISLITNFKLTCESAKNGVQSELYLLLDNHFKALDGLYKYHSISKEETTLTLTKINFSLDDDGLYYTAYQQPLNFNTASYQISAYDNTYFLMSIVGFFTILFGIFAAYKLFGRDRKTGQMDVILSQDVTFGQVFAAKFLAIVLSTLYVLGVFLIFTFVWSLLFNPTLANSILAVFNTTTPYTISPFLFLIIKVLGIELQVIFWAVITIFLMNLSRKFEVFFGVAIGLFAVVTICNIFLNDFFVYCLFPFIHADLTCMLGGGKMNAGFLQTPLYAYGNFFISLVYYVVVVGLLYNFTKQLFKKN